MFYNADWELDVIPSDLKGWISQDQDRGCYNLWQMDGSKDDYEGECR